MTEARVTNEEQRFLVTNDDEMNNNINNKTEAKAIEPLQVGDSGMVTWRDGTQQLNAVVIERRPADHWKRMKKRKIRTGNEEAVDNSTSSREELVGLEADEIHYYVHYVAHDRFVLHSHLLTFTNSINFYSSA